ncbi:CCA tRNA nucleotidyltransferase [Methylocystis heyeri]|uniref:CCA tRNA nucleotidyltransferase n=1 Tax=Methylocystis heyeri TaxID=391905 RepID=A0A6B8KBH7_9HYPH|nr:CCA tRNA nucleotidyltransferase [Methylocystis heyeri]QGM45027.1 CCA tRNA nucleotidyltransferase [Methylocystis heyeri]
MSDAARILDDPRLIRLFAALEATGCEARVVGGAVRDALLGLAPHEIDVATTALPDSVMAAARRACLKFAPTGLAHGTVTIVVEGTPYEVTTLRHDVETYGRAAKVRFGADFEEDALRRDFTVNALSLSPDGRLYDYTGGVADLERRRIRFIGDPQKRIAEDYLRILRFFRFHASIGEGPLDAEGFHAAVGARENLSLLSRERIRAELVKFMATRRAVETAREMSHAGFTEVLFGMAYPARLERFVDFERACGRSPDSIARLSAFTVLVREDADRLRDRLRLSNGEYARVSVHARAMESLHGKKEIFSTQELNEMLFSYGRAAALDILGLLHAGDLAAAEDDRWRAAADFLSDAEPPAFPVKGADLIALGVPPGETLGAALKRLQAKWIRAGFPREPHKVRQMLEEVAKRTD